MLAPQQPIKLIIQLMSVYGGFLTKKQSSHYFHLLQDLVKIIQSAVIDSLTKRCLDYQSFRQSFLKAYQTLQKLEIRKYMQPKYSTSLKPLFTLCYDHVFFPQKVFQVAQKPEINLQNKQKDVESIKKSIDLNTKSLIVSDENPLDNIPKWRSTKSKSFRYTLSKRADYNLFNLSKQLNTMGMEDRPLTTDPLTHRKNKSIPVPQRLGAFFQQPKSSRRQIYESFEKDYVLPAQSIEFQKKLSSLRRGNKVKLSIEHLL